MRNKPHNGTQTFQLALTTRCEEQRQRPPKRFPGAGRRWTLADGLALGRAEGRAAYTLAAGDPPPPQPRKNNLKLLHPQPANPETPADSLGAPAVVSWASDFCCVFCLPGGGRRRRRPITRRRQAARSRASNLDLRLEDVGIVGSGSVSVVFPIVE